MSLVNLFVAARSAIARRQQRGRAYAELTALDDRSLADIGLHRSQIPALIDGFQEPAHRAPEAYAELAPRGARSWLVGGHR